MAGRPSLRNGGTLKRRAALLIALAVACAAAAAAQPAIVGDYSGQYTCSQGLTGMTVRLSPPRAGTVDATIVFFAHPDNPGVPSGCYTAHGRIQADGHLVLSPDAWLYRPSDSWSMTVLDGVVSANGAFAGRVVAPHYPSACSTFALRRGATPFKQAPAQCTRPALTS